MKTKTLLPGAALLLSALIGTLLLNGCHTKPPPTPTEVANKKMAEASSKVDEIVTDPEKAAKVEASLKALTALVDEDAKAMAENDATLVALFKDYNSTADQFNKALADFSVGRQARVKQALQIAQDIRAQLTPEEWDKLNKARKEIFDAVTGEALSN